MTDRDAFYHAICAQPADDTARLVFADYLDESDDACRAAIVRAQVARPADEIRCRRMRLVSGGVAWRFDGSGLKDEALRKFGVTKRLRAELPPPDSLTIVESLCFRRGFVDAVSIAYGVWCLGHAELRARFPLTRVELTDEPELLSQTFDPTSLHFDSKKGVMRAVIAGDVVEIPASVQSRSYYTIALLLLAARWPGVYFTSPSSRRG